MVWTIFEKCFGLGRDIKVKAGSNFVKRIYSGSPLPLPIGVLFLQLEFYQNPFSPLVKVRKYAG